LKEEENAFVPCMARSANFDSYWHETFEVHKVEVLEIHNVWNVRFLWKKSLEVGEGCSIVKTFFVIERVQNSGSALAIVAFFLLSSKFHKNKIPTVRTKSFT
jgi:hypothetical protein